MIRDVCKFVLDSKVVLGMDWPNLLEKAREWDTLTVSMNAEVISIEHKTISDQIKIDDPVMIAYLLSDNCN